MEQKRADILNTRRSERLQNELQALYGQKVSHTPYHIRGQMK